ncbi:glycoside hydrolase family 3 C-terminal domain-containing protein [Asticcacaulis sp. EMRT-3]|uniref:glycoside hydrolase family 3 C-terminal domain-containing protein n=1 Tax=Asticcacaulis sp. EMRT-3 TaxID=3040349 RepID=UPI0024AFA774|nr:glycoside hydrolase family 3 C-terminal domain-containing protein [Asticcacaulis sp. EMRT-3]MDI7775713.1 glycoside hydrolase family 3 C-terminal domain-containing protein [Asticcacaulis sp. EMRT-3]
MSKFTTPLSLALLLTSVSALPALALPAMAADAPPPACADAPCAYLDTSLTPEARAKDLVSRMTLEEKAAQMQDNAPAIPRLGLKRYGWWNEALHGVARAGHTTVYPQAIGMAATWDPALMHDIGQAIADEGRANHNAALKRDPSGTDRYYGVNFWSPNINIFRDPRWGRGQETYGEDPYLTGKMAVGFITGIQTQANGIFEGVATPKHFAVHSGPEPLRHGFNVPVSPFDLEDTYLPAFRAAFTEGHAYSTMCAYNATDGDPMCASPLLAERIRGDWNFKGFIVSDCDAVDDMVTGHKSEPDAAHAAAAAVKAGTDLDCGTTYAALPQAVKEGLISEAEIDTSLERLMVARIRMGLIDGSPYDAIPASELNSSEHRALALRAAEEAMVLLKNSGVLPLKSDAKIAVVGPNADLLQSIEGNYTGSPLVPSLPLEAMRETFGAGHVAYAPGASLTATMRMPVPETYLKPAADSADHGLRAEYFDNKDFSGAPAMTRTDRVINFDWYHTAPQGLKPLGFSVRWTGVITPPAPGKYEIGFRMTPSRPGQPQPDVKVWIDGKLVVTPELVGISSAPPPACNSGMCAQPGHPVEVDFKDTKPHTVRIDYVRTTEDRASSFDWVAPAQPLIDGAVAAAKSSDAVVAFVGLSPDLEGEEMKVDLPGFNGGDRTNLALPEAQQKMLEAVKATGKPLVVVYVTGGEISDPWVEKNADAILQAWYPGEEGGHAIAATLSGQNNPSGRLPYTIYQDISELPPFVDYSMKGRTYRYFDGAVLHPFGQGLSYTRFAYAAPSLSASSIKAGDPVTATVQVSNTGKLDGDEVVELYVKRPGAAGHPVLAGFQRIHLKAGETLPVTLTLDARDLSQVMSDGARKVMAGDYVISLGGGQPGDAQTVSATLSVSGEADLPK